MKTIREFMDDVFPSVYYVGAWIFVYSFVWNYVNSYTDILPKGDITILRVLCKTLIALSTVALIVNIVGGSEK